MQNELDIVRDVSQRLDRAAIAYMLTGSMAMNYYAQPRMTRDIDMVVALGTADANKIVDLSATTTTFPKTRSETPSPQNQSSI